MASEWRVEAIQSRHRRAAFSCGQPLLDNFIRSLAMRYEKRGLGRTFVAVRPPDPTVLGYYTLTTGSVAFDRLPADATRELPRYPVPATLLARLAVDRASQGAGLGEGLLLDAVQRCIDSSAETGVYAVEVEAISEGASVFYRKYGFRALSDNPLHLYLPLAPAEERLGP